MQTDALIFSDKEPDIIMLAKAYEETSRELNPYFDQCKRNYDDRRNHWAGKSRDLRKHGSDAFPWEGAADMEAHVINERINAYVALFMSALTRANIRAYPVEAGDMKRARVTSSFLKWMIHSYIPNFKKQMELGANYLLERGILITYVGWERKDKRVLQKLDLQQIAQVAPQIAQGILDGTADDQVVAMLLQAFPGLKEKRARKALNDLRKVGVAEIPIKKRLVDRPCVKTLSPDGEVILPAYTTNPQDVPYCFWRTFMTAQQLLNKVSTDGWDAEWVDYIIEHYKGVNVTSLEQEESGRRSVSGFSNTSAESEDLYEIIYGYQRLVDKEDDAEGIYCTIFHREHIKRKKEDAGYAKFELLNGYDDYPFIVTRISEASKRLYDVMSFAELLRGIQWQVKIERDSRIDRNSLATVPWMEVPIGSPAPDIGPGKAVAVRRGSEIRYGPIPQYNPGSVEMEATLLKVADANLGLDAEDPLSAAKRQYFVDKFLEHIQAVIKMAFKAFQRFGPDQVWFRVTGVPDPQQFDKGNAEEDFDIMIGYDVLNADPESFEAKLQTIGSLFQFDRNGKIDPDAWIEMAASAIDPVMADTLLRSSEEAGNQVQKEVTDDLAKIFAGIEMPARPNGAQVAMQILQSYASQPDITGRLQSDEAFAARLQKYNDQYVFQLQQAQNAQIGKIGTKPAEMGGMQTQGMQQ